MVEVNERSALPLRLHNLLLALAGRLDDSALGQARKLAARARGDEAAELIAGTLVAGRIPVRAAEQAELVALLAGAGADTWLADHLLVDDAAVADGVRHRFSADGRAAEGVADALVPVLRVLPDVRSVQATWRNTVAGSVPGPMPQRLVLAEVGAGGSALATAYRMDVALRRAGISAAVEVTAPGSEGTEYHAQALAAAEEVPVDGIATAPTPPVEPKPVQPVEPAPSVAEAVEPEPVAAVEPEPVAAVEPEPEPAPPAEPPPVQPEPVAAMEPEPEPPVPAQPASASFAEPITAPVPEPPAQPSESELEPGELFWPQAEPASAAAAGQGERRTESTAEMTASELGLLRSALGKEDRSGEPTRYTQATEPTKYTQANEPTKYTQASEPTQITEPADAAGRPSADYRADELNNPQLSERDRELLRELHAELAKREREQTSQVRLNGWEHQG